MHQKCREPKSQETNGKHKAKWKHRKHIQNHAKYQKKRNVIEIPEDIEDNKLKKKATNETKKTKPNHKKRRECRENAAKMREMSAKPWKRHRNAKNKKISPPKKKTSKNNFAPFLKSISHCGGEKISTLNGDGCF